VLYQLTTGRLPFKGSSFAETVEKITRAQPEAIARFNYEVGTELERIIRKCLEKKPEDRYQTARELLIDFRRLKRESGSQAVAPAPRQRSPIRVGLVALTVVAVVLGGFWWSRRNAVSPDIYPYGKSVAVVSFEHENSGMDALAASLGDGLVNALGGVRKFDRVPPWEASSRADQLSPDKKAVAVRLGVSRLLTGSIRKEGDTVRISVKLLNPFDGKSGNVVWHYDHDYDEGKELPFETQDRITRSVVESLNVQLDNQGQSKFVNRFTESPEAYECYSKGRFLWSRRHVELEKAKHWFELALLYDSPTGSAEDSRMAPAWVGLADTYTLKAFYGFLPAPEATSKALGHIKKALAIDDTLTEAYATLGWIRLNECDGPGAAAAFEKSIELNDRYVPAYQWYASYFNAIGDLDNAAIKAKEALEIDSVTEGSKTISAWQLGKADPTEAVQQLDEVIQRQPQFALAHYVRGEGLIELKQVDAAVQSYESALRLSDDQAFYFYLSGVAYAYAKAGRREEAWRTIKQLETVTDLAKVPTLLFASACLELGDKERCYEILERSLVEGGGNPWLLYRGLHGIESEPRFIDLINRTGLLKYNPTTQAFEVNSHSPNE